MSAGDTGGRVRPATRADLDEILDLVRELAEYERLAHEVVFDAQEFGEHLFGADPVARVLLAETDDGETVGFALCFRTFSTFLGRPGIWLEDCFVRPGHRGRGHGRRLLEAVRTLTDARVEWSVLDWNEPAHGFYRALGAAPMEDWTTWRWLPGS